MSTPPSLPPKTPDLSNNQGTPSPLPAPQPIPRVQLSDDIKSLPTEQLKRLFNSVEVLKGYLITLNEKQLNQSVDELDSIIRDIEHFIRTLGQLQSSKEEINRKLPEIQRLAQEWETKEVEMYSSLKRFGAENLYSLLSNSVVESKKLTNSISQSFIQDVEEHDEASIQSFIKSYRNERKLYYLRSEKLHRFNEDRIGGLL